MDSTGDDAQPPAAPRVEDELLALARQLRGQLERHAALGAWAAPAAPTAAYSGSGGGLEADAELEASVEAGAGAATADAGVVAASARAGAVTATTGASAVAATAGAGAVTTTAGAVAVAATAAAPASKPEVPDALRAPDSLGTSPRREGPPISAAAPDLPLFDVPAEALARRTLAQIREDVGECTRCKLHTTRKNIVFGVGAEDAPLMFIGEAPGEQEDLRGEPFVGRAGELLDKMIEAMGWTRDRVYIANTLMCRPPGNRNPQADETSQCSPFLDAKIRSIAPRLIVTLGRPAANYILANDAPISALRGRFHERHGIKVMPTFHPAYLLRDPAKKKEAWADLKQVIVELERLGIAAPNPPRG